MNENIFILLAAVVGMFGGLGIPALLWPVPKPKPKPMLPPRLTQADVDETIIAARKELDLPLPPDLVAHDLYVSRSDFYYDWMG